MVTKAIIIIYADGYIDSFDICEEGEHIDYYKKFLLSSKRFIELCKNCNFELGVHYHIDRILAKSGAIVFINWNLKEIIQDSSYLYKHVPGFIISLPENNINEKQRTVFEEMIKDYPKEKIEISKYQSEIDEFVPYPWEDFLENKYRL